MSSTDKKSQAVPVDAEALLAQREKELNLFLLQKEQMGTLIKMIGKVTESIVGKYNKKQCHRSNFNLMQNLL